MSARTNTDELRPPQRKRKLALAGVVVALLAGLAVTQSKLGLTQTHQALEQIGLVLILAGILGRVWCTMHIGGQKFTALVTCGPFSISRNPLYVFSLTAAFGAGLQSGSLLFAIVTTMGAWAVIDATVRREEKALSARFGEAYADYCARTPRYLPRFSSWRGESTLTVQMPLVYRTLSDGLLFYAIVPISEAIDWAQAAGYLPVLLKLPF